MATILLTPLADAGGTLGDVELCVLDASEASLCAYDTTHGLGG